MRSSISTPRHALSQWPWMAWNTLAVALSLAAEPSAKPFLWGASTEGAILLYTECAVGDDLRMGARSAGGKPARRGFNATMPKAVRQLGRVPS